MHLILVPEISSCQNKARQNVTTRAVPSAGALPAPPEGKASVYGAGWHHHKAHCTGTMGLGLLLQELSGGTAEGPSVLESQRTGCPVAPGLERLVLLLVLQR